MAMYCCVLGYHVYDSVSQWGALKVLLNIFSSLTTAAKIGEQSDKNTLAHHTWDDRCARCKQ